MEMVGAFPNLQPLLERHQERDAASLSEASMDVEFGLPNLRRCACALRFEVPKGSLAAGDWENTRLLGLISARQPRPATIAELLRLGVS